VYRLPDGTYTEDTKKMSDAWKELYEPIEKALPGWTCHGMDPGISFIKYVPTSYDPKISRSEGFVEMPVNFAQALVKALKKNENN
jgi:hypothetical protein